MDKLIKGKVFNRLNVKSILVCMDDTANNKIGDCIVRLSNMKLLKHNFPNAKIYVNTPSKVFYSVAKHSPIIKEITDLSIDNVEYNNYEMVLVCCNKKRTFLKCIADYVDHCGHMDFLIFDVSEGQDLEQNTEHIPPLPMSDGLFTPESLRMDISRKEISLTDDELNEGTKFLNQYITTERVIVFFITASYYAKLLRMSVTTEVIKYFQSLPSTKLIIFDPGQDKDVFLTSMGVDVENILIIKQKSLREVFAIMADSRVELILGPCTGLMHAASGIYNSLVKKGSLIKTPSMIVYTGLYYEMSNAVQWWKGSLVKCLVLHMDQNNQKKVSYLEDVDERLFRFQEDLLPTREYTFEMIKDVLQHQLNLC